MNISRPGRLILTTLSLTALSTPVLSQDGTGIRGKLSFDQRLEFADNPNLNEVATNDRLTSTSFLRFDIDSETRTERFNVNISGDLRGATGEATTEQDDFTFGNERAGISYSREGSNTRLSLRANYDNVNIEDEVIGFLVDGEFDPTALIIEGGQRRQTSFRANFETGVAGPFGLNLTARQSDREFIDVIDPELTNRESISFDGVARLEVNQALTARILGGISQSEEESLIIDAERETRYIGAGLQIETRGGVVYSGDLTFDQAETREAGLPDRESDGLGFSLSAAQEVRDGIFEVALSSRIDSSGRRTNASVSRDFDLPNGDISVSLGLSDQEDETAELTTRLSFTREFRDAAFVANVVQQPTTDAGTAFLNTSVELNYLQELTPISSWDAAFSYGAASEFGSNDQDTRTSASVAYSRDLNEDWTFRTGISLVRIEDDDGEDRSNNSVFFSVGRDFTFGF